MKMFVFPTVSCGVLSISGSQTICPMLYLVVSLSIVEVPCRFFWLFKLRTQIAVAMARGKHSGKGKGQAAQQAQWLTRVDLYKFLPKWLLRSYPDGRGRPLFSAPSELTPSKIREVLDGDCSELLRRPVMGVNLCSASVDAAGLFLPKLMDLLPSVGQVLEKDALSEAVRYSRRQSVRNEGMRFPEHH